MKKKTVKNKVIKVPKQPNSENIKLHMQEWHAKKHNKFANGNCYREFFWEEFDRVAVKLK